MDIVGNPRIFAGELSNVDVGAYEFQGEPTALYVSDTIFTNTTWSVDTVYVIDSLWIDKSFKNYADSDETFFLKGYEVNQVGYGYLWWIMEANGYTYYSAYGAGDQFLLINPETNTIFVIAQLYKDSWFEQKEDVDLLFELLSIVDSKK